jgi:translocator protein
MGKRAASFGLAAACVSACVFVGFASAALSPRDDWYDQLRKPVWMPPGWIFGVVWALLYAVMGVALSLVLARGWSAGGVRRAAAIFGIQLVVNFSWSAIFFRFHSPSGAMVVIVALWLMIGWTVAAFWSVRDVAGALLLPYWVWVTLAVALSTAIWRMN